MNILTKYMSMSQAQMKSPKKSQKGTRKKQPKGPAQKQNDEMIRDVDDSLRQDQLNALWTTYGSTAVTLVVGIILVTAVISGWNSWTTAKNQKITTELLAAKDSGTPKEALSEFIQTNKGTHQAIATLELAGQYRTDGDLEKAATLYKQVSENTKMDAVYRDLGTLLYATIDTHPKSKDLLEALAQNEESPWRAHAGLEWALFQASLNNYTGALDTLAMITALDSTPTGIRQKATTLMTLYKLKGADK